MRFYSPLREVNGQQVAPSVELVGICGDAGVEHGGGKNPEYNLLAVLDFVLAGLS